MSGEKLPDRFYIEHLDQVDVIRPDGSIEHLRPTPTEKPETDPDTAKNQGS